MWSKAKKKKKKSYVYPIYVAFQFVTRQAQQFDIALFELVHQNGHFAQFGSADRCEIRRVREQHAPSVRVMKKTKKIKESRYRNRTKIYYYRFPSATAVGLRLSDPFVESDGPFGGDGREVRNDGAQTHDASAKKYI